MTTCLLWIRNLSSRCSKSQWPWRSWDATLIRWSHIPWTPQLAQKQIPETSTELRSGNVSSCKVERKHLLRGLQARFPNIRQTFKDSPLSLISNGQVTVGAVQMYVSGTFSQPQRCWCKLFHMMSPDLRPALLGENPVKKKCLRRFCLSTLIFSWVHCIALCKSKKIWFTKSLPWERERKTDANANRSDLTGSTRPESQTEFGKNVKEL